MPWKETGAMDQRHLFIKDWLRAESGKKALCLAYGISRPTGDKWIARFLDGGLAALEDRHRAPGSHPNATPEILCARLVEARLAHPHWGPRKILQWLRHRHPGEPWPADSTAGDILKREGLVPDRKRRRRTPPNPGPLASCHAPNQSWSVDFKGDFRLGDGRRCYPLTLSDNHSRMLLLCRALERPSAHDTGLWLEHAFREHGLPHTLRSDNGAPFASTAPGGLSALAARWIRLGIRPERIRPGHPEENGRHERMHRTLKQEATRPPGHTLRDQQRRFDAFREQYNRDRPHQALSGATPESAHAPSPRPWPSRVPPVEYDGDTAVRRVRSNGEIKWRGKLIYLTSVLVGEPVGLRPLDQDRWEVCYSFHPLAILDQRNMTLRPWQDARRRKDRDV